MPSPGTVPATRPAREPGRALAVICAATLLILMIYTAPMTVLRQMTVSLHAGPTAQTWLLNGITLGLAGALLTSGSLADNLGRRATFLSGTALLALASFAAALVPDATLFIVARVVQGVAAAAVLAAGLGLIGHAYPPGPALHAATGRWGAMLGAGIAIGPIISAGLGHLSSWRTFHLVAALLATLVTVAGARWLNESRAERPARIDVRGAVTLGAGLTALLVAVTAARSDLRSSAVVLPLLVSGALAPAFVASQRRVPEPMIDFALLRRPAFRAATIGALFTGVAVIAPMSLLPTAIQRADSLSPLTSALLLAIWSGTAFVVSLQLRRLGGRLSGTLRLVAGFVLCALGYLAMLGFAATHTWSRIVPGLVVAGVGTGVINATLARMAVESVPAGRVAMGSGANNTARYIGSALGVAFIVLVPAGDPDATLLLACALGLLGAALVPLAGRPARAIPTTEASRAVPAEPVARTQPAGGRRLLCGDVVRACGHVRGDLE